MSNPYIGEIRIFAGNYAPDGWMFCAGGRLSISEYSTLYQLIGTTYGGDGQTYFNLPDLRGRLPLHQGSGFTLGQAAGQETVTLTVLQIPSHTHPLMASANSAAGNMPTGNVTGETSGTQIYRQANPTAAMSAQAITAMGGNQPHNNMQPFLCLNFIISLFGVYPTQT